MTSNFKLPGNKAVKHNPAEKQGRDDLVLCLQDHPYLAKVIAESSEVGSRAVQFVLTPECGLDSETNLKIAYCFVGTFKASGKCPKLNHVVQACFVYLSNESELIDLVLGELLTPDTDEQQSRAAMVRKTAEHKFGCRIVQRMLEYLSMEQLQKHGILHALLDTTVDHRHGMKTAVYLCMHQYANFVMQTMLTAGVGSEEQGTGVSIDNKEQLMQIIIEHAVALGEPRSTLSQDSTPAAGQSGAAVIAAAFKQSNVSMWLKRQLAEMLVGSVNDLQPFVSMGCTRYGHLAAKEVLAALSEEKRMDVVRKLVLQTGSPQDETHETWSKELRASRYGRVLNRYMSDEILGKGAPHAQLLLPTPHGVDVPPGL
jgi:hypothetical protein